MNEVYIARARCGNIDAANPSVLLDFAFEVDECEKVNLEYARFKVIKFLQPIIGKNIGRVDVLSVRRSKNLVLIPPFV